MKSKKIIILICVAANIQLTLIGREPEAVIQPTELVDDDEGNFNSVVIKDTLLVDNIIKTNKLIVDQELETTQAIINNITIQNASILNLTATSSYIDNLTGINGYINNLTGTNGYIDNLNANSLNVSGSSLVGCDVFVGCNLYIPETTAADQGVIFKYSGTTAAPTTTPFLHNAGIDSVFLGENSGNFTGGNANIGIGTATLSNVTNTSINNIAIGHNVLEQNQGNDNVGIGNLALKANTVGNGNLALGAISLQKVVGGSNNVGLGNAAGANLINGSTNICIGFYGGSNLINGSNNIIIANDGNSIDSGVIRIGTTGTHTTNFQAGIRGVTAAVLDTAVVSIDSNGQLGTGIITNNINITGSSSTGGNILKNGFLFIHDTGSANTFVGAVAGNVTLTGIDNTAIGYFSCNNLTSGIRNTAIGSLSMQSIQNGARNTACGANTLRNIVSGSDNVSLGEEAGYNITTGSNNIALGSSAGYFLSTENNTIYIGNQGFPGISNAIFIGSAGTHTTNFQAGIFNSAALSGGTPVYIDGTNRLSTNSSSKQYKENITSITSDTLQAFKQLDPVSFTYIGDKTQTIQYGFIAEDVEPLMPELIVRDNNGAIYTIKYHLIYALLYAWLQNIQQKQSSSETILNEHQTTINNLRNDLNNAQSLITTLSSRVAALERILNINS